MHVAPQILKQIINTILGEKMWILYNVNWNTNIKSVCLFYDDTLFI